MKKIVFLFVLFVVKANAQTILKGRVMENNTEPAIFATVSVLAAKDSTVVKATLSNDEGYFTFDKLPVASYFLKVSYIGFSDTWNGPIITNNITDIGSIILKAQSTMMEEVKVTTQRALVEKKSDRLVVNLENSVLTKGRTGVDILNVVPMVKVGIFGGISVRGKTNVMVLIDNKQVPNTTLSNVLGSVSAEDIVKIEVITNPSSKYDASASGGVINIITKKSLENGFKGSYRQILSQGMRNRLNTGVSLNYHNNKLSVFSNLLFNRSDIQNNDYLINTFDSEKVKFDNRSKTDYNNLLFNGSVGLEYAINKNNLIGFVIDNSSTKLRSKVSNDLFFYSINDQNTILSGTRSDGNGKDLYQIPTFNLNYRGVLPKGELSFLTTYTYYKNSGNLLIDYFDVNSTNTKIGANKQIDAAKGSKINLLISQIDYSLPVSEKTKIDIGAKISDTKTDNFINQNNISEGVSTPIVTPFSESGYVETITAGYFNLSQQIGKANLQLGLRAENTNANVRNVGKRNYLDWFPTVGFSKEINKDYLLGLSYSRKVDRPPFEILIPFLNYVNKYTIRSGNPNLMPQYSNVLELNQTFKDVNVILSYTNTKDAMMDIPKIDNSTKITTFLFQNLDKNIQYTGSVSLPFNPKKWLQSNITLLGGYQELSDKGLNQNLPFSASAWFASLNIVNTLNFANDWKGELTFEYNSPRVDGINRMKNASDLGFAMAKSFWNKQATFKLGVSDIFWTNRWRGSAAYGNVNQIFNNYYDSRRVRASFTYNFGKKTALKASEKSLGNEAERGRIGR